MRVMGVVLCCLAVVALLFVSVEESPVGEQSIEIQAEMPVSIDASDFETSVIGADAACMNGCHLSHEATTGEVELLPLLELSGVEQDAETTSGINQLFDLYRPRVMTGRCQGVGVILDAGKAAIGELDINTSRREIRSGRFSGATA